MYDEKIKYWVEISDENLETAEILSKKNKTLFCGYLLKQATEKSLKVIHTRR